MGIFYKKVDLEDATHKYGFSQLGFFAKEFISKGEDVFKCDYSKCDYLLEENFNKGKTREETLEIMKNFPHTKEFILKYNYKIDDDCYDWPKGFMDLKLVDNCMYFNHSCDANLGYGSLDSGAFVAIRDIEPGEELTFDYQIMDSRPSFYDGLNCKCKSYNCRGLLSMDHYRNVDWQFSNYKHSSGYIQRKIDELKTRWYSARAYPKYYTNPDGEKQLGLSCLERIRKDDIVAIFSDQNNINPGSHYIRHNDNPTCYLVGNEVFARTDIEPETELSLDFK